MSVLNDATIRYFCQRGFLIWPWNDREVYNGMSYGISVAGYDVRARFDEGVSDKFLYPGKFMLAGTLEKFNMPNNVIGFVHDKSTWARKGLAVQNTVIEPGWTGYLTLELTNHSMDVLRINTGDPIAQIVFHFLNANAEKPYDGKYQDQEAGPQEARYE